MDLLNEYLALTTDEERLAFLAALSAEDLEAVTAAALEAFTDAETQDPTDEVLATMSALADTIEACAAQEAVREADTETRRARQAELAERVRGEAGGDDGDEETPPAEGEEEETPPEGEETPPAEEEAETPEQLAAAAAGRTTTPRPRISRVARNRPAAQRPQPSLQRGVIRAATDVPDVAAGAMLDGPLALAAAISSRIESIRGYYDGPPQKLLVASIVGGFAEDRMLGRDALSNAEKVEPVLTAAAYGDAEALVASGGLCAPTTVRYDLPTLGDDARPVRDSLPRFGAERGGVRWMPSPDFTALNGALDVWTMADDEAAVDDPDVRKPCLRVVCPDETEALTQAITECLEFGNVVARTFPELVAAWLRLVGVAWARKAENELLTAINAGSTQVTSGQLLGATRDVLAVLDRANAYYRYRYRLSDNARLRWMAPRYIRDMIRTDLAREMPGSNVERLAMADAQIAEFFAVRNISVTWHMDGVVAPFTTQGTGPLQGYPSTVQTQLFLEGTWVHLDGGRLDLGVFRDSDLVASNDYRMFSESWEYAAKFGPGQSMRLTLDLCPDGATSGTVDIDPCTTGS